MLEHGWRGLIGIQAVESRNGRFDGVETGVSVQRGRNGRFDVQCKIVWKALVDSKTGVLVCKGRHGRFYVLETVVSVAESLVHARFFFVLACFNFVSSRLHIFT